MNYLPIKLAKLRKHYNYSQSYIADYLDVEVKQYMAYENGSAMINYSQMKKLSNLYNISMSEMFMNIENATLHDLKHQNTDEINTAYFMPEKNIRNTIKGFIVNHKLASIIIGVLVVAIVVLSIILSNTIAPYENKLVDINRLSVSETTVVYIDDSGAIGFSGSNTNGQLNDLASNSAIKVAEGSSFTVVLNADGTVISSGLIEKYAKEVNGWKNIVDIACGDNHVLGLDANGRVRCVGDDRACEVAGSKNIKKVFACDNGSVLLDDVGRVTYSGSFIGSSTLKNIYNILDIDCSDNILVILNSDNTLNVNAKSGSYLKSETLTDIVDIACGNDFVAALDSYGKVHIEINNDEIIEQVADWSNIIAIDAGNDYLIGFDGKNIYGVGNNSYDQFKKETKQKITLEKVSDINYILDEENITIGFNGVANANGYMVELNVGTGLSRRSEQESVVFPTENMVEGKTYTISITSMGNSEYKDSDAATLNFIYQKPNMIDVNPSEYVGMDVKYLQIYLEGLGIAYEGEVSSTTICNDEQMVLDIIDFEDGRYNKNDLDKMVVKYTCCKVE